MQLRIVSSTVLHGAEKNATKGSHSVHPHDASSFFLALLELPSSDSSRMAHPSVSQQQRRSGGGFFHPTYTNEMRTMSAAVDQSSISRAGKRTTVQDHPPAAASRLLVLTAMVGQRDMRTSQCTPRHAMSPSDMCEVTADQWHATDVRFEKMGAMWGRDHARDRWISGAVQKAYPSTPDVKRIKKNFVQVVTFVVVTFC